jgi:hypothetical protein
MTSAITRDTSGVALITVMQGMNQVVLQNSQVMLTMGQLIQEMSSKITDASNNMLDIAKNLQITSNIETIVGGILTIVSLPLTFGTALIGVQTEVISNFAMKLTQVFKMNILKLIFTSSLGAGIILNAVKAYCSNAQGIDNAELTEQTKFNDVQNSIIQVTQNSYAKYNDSITAIAKAMQQAAQDDYNAKKANN